MKLEQANPLYPSMSSSFQHLRQTLTAATPYIAPINNALTSVSPKLGGEGVLRNLESSVSTGSLIFQEIPEASAPEPSSLSSQINTINSSKFLTIDLKRPDLKGKLLKII